MLQLPCMLVCRLLPCALARETAGAASTRSSLRPLSSGGQTKIQTSGDQRREIANVYSALRIESENSSVVPANAGTHSHRPKLFCKVVVTLSFLARTAAAYGSLRSQGRRWSDRCGNAGEPAYLLRRRFTTARVGAARQKSQRESADRENRDQLLDADGADHLD